MAGGIQAQQTGCSDLNGYVDSKNINSTGYYTLTNGAEEKAAQTYHYSGPGKVDGVSLYGNYPGIIGGAPLRVGIYDVDANGRPTTLIQAQNVTWWWFDNIPGQINVNFGGGGIYVNADFAVIVELRNASPWGNSFQVRYTGDGEGLGQDLASLAGTSTGFNWSSAMTNFNKDGDFYLVPRMTNFIESSFAVSSECISTNGSVTFTNNSSMTLDSMFNTIALNSYSGSNYFYSWDFGDGSPISHTTSPSHTYTTAGSYTVSLTCTIDGWNGNCTDVYTDVVSVGLASTTTVVNATCYGSSNGSITVNATGGTAPYQYMINDGSYQGSNVFSGLAAGSYNVSVLDANGCEYTIAATVTQPTEIVFTALNPTNSSCGSSNGGIVVAASGGTGALQYELNNGPFQSSGTFSSLASGYYMITAKDANGCTSVAYVTVSDQGAPQLQILSTTNASCNGSNDGSIVVIGTGGSGTLQYSIDGGNTWQTSGSFPNLPAGVYGVMVKDANGCKSIVKISIAQPNAITVAAASTNVSCNGGNDGTITVGPASGGTGTYTYSVDGVNFQSSSSFSGLVAGTYTVTIHDVASCSGNTTVTITQPTAITASATTTPALCHGEYNGSLTVTATGGTSPYMYSLDGENFQSYNSFSELEAGTYTVTVRDANGCQYIMTVTVTEPSIVSASITTGSSTCGNANGTLLVIGSGGSGSGYQYSINGTTFNGSGSFTGLTSGAYYVIVTDGSGCMQVFNTSIVDANGPTITSISHTDVACNGGNDGTITINTVSGGTGTLQYSVNGYWQTSNSFSGLDAGTYTVLVKDANGCVGETTVTLTQPNAFVMTSNVINVSCNGDHSGSVTVAAAGGSGTLAYSIDGGETFQSSTTFSGLGAGTYTVMVRDAAGCTGSISFVITEPTLITATVGVLNVSCSGAGNGGIFVFATGGTGALQYSIDGVNYQSGYTFNNLSGGTYNVYVKDANGCVRMFTAHVAEPTAIVVGANVIDVTCAGGNNAVIDLSVSGGVGPYSFDWSDKSQSEDLFNLSAGTYTVTVTDENGCQVTQTYTVNQPANPLIVNGVIANATSQTAVDGSVDITITGGSGPYTFLWSNGATTEDISGVAPGVYTVMITDANGCVTSGTFTVSFTIGINTPVIAEGITLYPNPAHEQMTIESKGMTIDKMEVMNIVGQLVFVVEPRTSKVLLSTETFDQGVYLVRLHIGGQVVTKRFEVIK